MSGLSVKVEVDPRAIGLGTLFARVTGPQARTRLHNRMALGVREATRDYVREEAGKRHATAERLGGSPTGHLEQAAQAVEGAPIAADGEHATLTINHPGLGRAFHDVTIVPKNGARALTIPVAGAAYGRRAGEFDLFLFRSRVTGNAFLALRQSEKGARPLLMFLLVSSVTQPQDRTLLPSDEAWTEAAGEAAREWFHQELSP